LEQLLARASERDEVKWTAARQAPSFDVSAAEEAFRSYNCHRRRRLSAQISGQDKHAIDVLPLLLHLNQPGLPGYVDERGCLVGVADYSPTHYELTLARRLFPASNPRRSGILRPVIDLVAAMGSVGTIGFSGDSDLDIWVCYDGKAPEPSIRLYREKVRGIDAWLHEHSGLEFHLFFQATEQSRANDFGEAGVEGCGSAMGTLLKEEFYRTGIVLAGKAPFWWLVPPGACPQVYANAIQALSLDPSFPSASYVDLGWVAQVPVEELFGAAIWQIVKGWKSPFKSSLKMGLLEKAVLSKNEGPPLCEILKERVLAGETPDPYRLLFDEVLAYYNNKGDAAAADLLARSFYLKVGTRLDPGQIGEDADLAGDEAVIAEYVREWGWGARRIRHLNEFGRWKFEWLQALAREMDRYFLRTYKRIRAALDESGETQHITPRDLTLLGRKLQAVYRRVPYKVESLHLGAAAVEEPILSLYQETLPDGESPWRLYRGRVTPINVEESEGQLLRLGPEPLELLVWASWNGILGSRTRLLSQGTGSEVPAAELEAVGLPLASFTREARSADPSPETLLGEPSPARLLAVPNLGLGAEEVREIGAVWTSTWGELFYRRWSGPEAFRGFVGETLVPFLLESRDPREITVFVPPRKVGSMRGSQRRLGRELPAIAEFLGGNDILEGLRRRCVGLDPRGYFVLDRANPGEVRHRVFPDREGLLRYLSGVGPYRRVETRVESHPGDLAVLKAVVETSAPGLIDVFVLSERQMQTFFVADEIGNLIHFPHQLEAQPYALSQLLVFLEGVLPEIAAQPESPLAGRDFASAVRIHTLVFEGTCRAFTTTNEHLARVKRLALRPIGLTIERTGNRDGSRGGYRITWGNQVLESGEEANPLEELRGQVRKARRSGAEYDLFVTRLFLDERFTTEYCGPFVATGHYLFYKKAIEQRLSS
jgi:adenylate cyclase class 1